MIDLQRRGLIVGGAAALILPRRGLAGPGSAAARAGGATPEAVAGMGWTQKSDWNFGTNGGNITRFTDWLGAGWFMDSTPRYLNNECQTYNTGNLSNSNGNFQPSTEHCDIVAIWNGGKIASAQDSGSISSLMVRYDVPFSNAIGYYELNCKIPSVSGAWPAWWTLGHKPGSARGSYTWGPEIDIFEFYDTATGAYTSTLHGSQTPSYCFINTGGNPPGTPDTAKTAYEGNHPWNLGNFTYAPGFEFSQAYHRFGLRIDRRYEITLWCDDVKIGTFASNQYCNDAGEPVSVELLIGLALGTNNPDPVDSIHTADFGGINNTSAANKFRLSLKNIQIWGP